MDVVVVAKVVAVDGKVNAPVNGMETFGGSAVTLVIPLWTSMSMAMRRTRYVESERR